MGGGIGLRGLLAWLALAGAAAPGWCQDLDPAAPPPKLWEGRFALGGSLRGGDESRYSANADARLERRFERDTLVLTALADYGQSGGERDSENYGGEFAWRRALNDRFFWRSSAGVDSDPVQGRNLRVTVDSGPGYRIWEAGEERFFDLYSGLGYRHERFRRDEGTNDLADLRAGYTYRDTIGDVLEVVHESEAFAPVNDFESFLAKSEVTLSVPLFGGLHFRNNGRYEYVNDPAQDRESSNFWLTIGLEYRL